MQKQETYINLTACSCRFTRARKGIGILSILLILLFSCKSKPPEKIIARVGPEKITMDYIETRTKNYPKSYQEYLYTGPGRKQLLDSLIGERLIVQLAEKRELHKRREIIESVEDFKKDYQRRIKEHRDNLLITTFLKELKEEELKPTEQGIKEYYSSHKKEFTRPIQTRISHILVSSEQEARRVLNRIKSGEDFAELAQETSIDPATAQSGGNLGLFKYGEMLPEFSKVVRKLKVGGVSDVVRTSYGYHLIKKTGQKALPKRTFTEAKPDVARLLIKERFEKWIDKKKQELKVEIYE